MQAPTTDLDVLAGNLRSVLGPLARRLRQQSSDPLTATQVSVLGAIHRNGPIPLGDVAVLEHLSPPTISKVVGVLEDLGFVDRVRDRTDRRVWLVRTSDRGERWIEQGRARRDAWLAERLAELAPDQVAALTAAVPVLEQITGEAS